MCALATPFTALDSANVSNCECMLAGLALLQEQQTWILGRQCAVQAPCHTEATLTGHAPAPPKMRAPPSTAVALRGDRGTVMKSAACCSAGYCLSWVQLGVRGTMEERHAAPGIQLHHGSMLICHLLCRGPRQRFTWRQKMLVATPCSLSS